MYGCQQIMLHPDELEKEILVFICQQANKLVNCGTYLLRQAFFTFGQVEHDAYSLHAELKDNPHFKILRSAVAQQVLTGVAESFKSYKELTNKFFKGEISDQPKLPKYRKKGGLATISYPARWVSFDQETGQASLSLGKTFKEWFGIEHIQVPPPYGLRVKDIAEIRILPRNGCFYAEYTYKMQPQIVDLSDKALGIDPGLNNWLTCVSTDGDSFIVDGRKVKSLNQWYNKQVAKQKKNKAQDYWDEKLAQLSERRNRQMRDALNKAARLVINYCLSHDLGTIVFGWNQGNKNRMEMGKKNNQEFVGVPTAKLKERIAQLCQQYGLKFIETEESYTSKSSFLDGDFLPKFGEKPERWKPSGRRVSRGMYRTKNGTEVNADINGAANILRKVEIQLSVNLAKVCRAFLTVPTRYKVWETKRRSVILMRSFTTA
ncbi:MAG: IS200/IS605 family element transposase accessory protein TnpB [Symploca sp. SIO3C6]|nr:IS200/IS605 family element transposase accessory protein TnpB [Symploca sp. SIO3C6]